MNNIISPLEDGIIDTIRKECEKDNSGYKVDSKYLLLLLKNKGYTNSIQEKHLENDLKNIESEELKTHHH